MNKRLLCILLTFCMALTLFPLSALANKQDGEAEPAPDMQEDSAEEPYSEAAALLDAGDTMTRGAWMHELVSLFGLTLTKDEYPDVYFPDISESEYFDDIMIATKYGLVEVEAGDNFEPDTSLTRDFAAHTLNFYLGIQNGRDSYSFSDSGNVTWCDDAQIAVDQGWFALSDGKFNPQTEVTAEETATMISFARDALQNRNVGESVSNYSFSSYVKELPSTAEIKSTLDIETGTVTLKISGYSGTLTANDTIVFYSDGFAFVYGVASVTENNGVLTVITKEAPDDAIERFEQAGEIQPELEPYLPEDNEPVSLMAADGDMVTFDRVELLEAGKHKISYKRDFNKNGLSGKLSAEITDITLSTDFIGDEQHVTISGKITLSSTMELDFLNDPAAASLTLGGVSIGKYGSVGVDINLKAAASIAYEYSATFTVGIEKRNSSKSVVHELTASDTCITAKGTASAKLALAAHLDFGKAAKFYAGIGIGPTLSAKLKQYPNGTPQRCLNLSGYLAAGIEVSAKLGNLKYEYTKDIYTEKNSPIRVVEHIEDGVTVPECTREKDSGTAETGYSTPKYTTPTNSRYYASGVSNVGSTGYDGYGNTEPVVIWQTSDNGDGTVTITGYSGNASILNIPETIDGKTVVVIGKEAFKNNHNIRIVNIPSTVTSIDVSSFSNCISLTTVHFSEGLTNISYGAFSGCTSLLAAELPEGLISLGSCSGYYAGGVFSGCIALEKAYIPSTLDNNGSTSYYYTANFNKCSSLNTVEFGEGIPKIAGYLFMDCTGLEQIIIPNTVTSIEHEAFSGCTQLTSVQFSQNLTNISYGAFSGCTSLLAVELPEGLISLGTCSGYYAGGVFSGCSALQKVYIPSTLDNNGSTSYYYTANFNKCPSLNTVEFGEGIPKIAGRLFFNCTGLSEIVIPDTVTSIGSSAFENCTELVFIQIPDAVSSIGDNAFYNSGLTTITIPDTTTAYCDGILRNCAKLVTANLSKSALVIPASMFSGCSSLESISIPDGVTEIKNDTFNGCSALRSVTLPDSVTKIRNNAFNGCASLTDISWIPKTVTSIGNSAFENCVGLVSAVLPGQAASLGSNAFKGCTSLVSFKSGAGLTSMGANCFQDCASLINVDLAHGLTTIGNYAFQNCTALETIVLPDNVTSIGTYCFQKDTSLKNVTLSGGLETIPSYAFANCTALENLEIPSGVTTIKDHAFYQNTKLKTFVIPSSVTTIEDNAFSYPTSTTVYGVPGSYAETYAKWAAFLDISQYRKTGTMGPGQEIQWSYDPSTRTVTVTGAVSASDAVYVGSYDAKGQMISLELITSSGGTAQAASGANSIMMFWLDRNLVPKCGKQTIHTA